MAIKHPAPLNPGATVALLAPSSPLANPKDLATCVQAAKDFDLNVVEYPTLTLADDYMSGTRQQRTKDLHRAFRTKSIDGILCMRGGYSACHTLPLVDWKEVGQSGKLFAGFSDITTILTAMTGHSKLASLHAPTMSYFKGSELQNWSHEVMKKFLFEPWKNISYQEICGKHLNKQTIIRGKAKGTILGGNAAVFASLAGTPYLPKRGSYILFLEDIGERPYKLDRYVTQLIQCGFMDRVTGVVLGQFTNCEPKAPDTGSANEVIGRLLRPLKIPVLAGLPIGHDNPSVPLPIGVTGELDASRGELYIP